MPELAAGLASLIAEGCEQLRLAGIPNPRRETLCIWSELNGQNAVDTLVRGPLEAEPHQAARFQLAIRRRAQGEPRPHVTGWAGFRSLTLHSDSRALIPRPETEGLVELLLQRIRCGVVADIGTGSGCIALSLGLEGGFTRVVAVDSSAEALELAQLNAGLVGAPAAVDFIRADLQSSLSPESLDALISNPPYLTLSEYDALDSSVRLWEPAEALRSGVDGLESTVRLLTEGGTVLKPGGWLVMEVDCTRATIAAERASQNGWDDVQVHLDLFGRERYLLARRSETR